MDTLIYTASTFIIPINVAAYTGKYVLMNLVLFLTLTSWAHHSICHTQYKSKECDMYEYIDSTTCYWVIFYSFVYALFYTTPLQFILYSICLSLVFYSYYHVHKNNNYYKRGLSNWHYHKYHILMHISACIGLTIIAL